MQVDWVEKDCGSFQPWRLSRIGGEEKRQSKWTELVCLICVHVITGYGDEEQCCHSHQHLQVGRGPTVWERTILSVEFHAK